MYCSTYFVIGLLMCGNCFGVLCDLEGGVAKPVPHLGGMCCIQCPFEGNICLRVDHCSQREEGADEAYTPSSSAARENTLSGASDGGTQ